MPVSSGMGQSQMTFDKQDGLARILRQHIATVKAIARKWRFEPFYHYIDLTAGCGHNIEIDCEGSPVIFERTIRQASIPYEAHLIDIEEKNTLELDALFGTNQNITIRTGDHTDIAPIIARSWRKSYVFGLIYADTNGVPPFSLLAELGRIPNLQRVDFLIRYTGSGAKRAGYRLLEELAKIEKQHWIVRDLNQHDRWQWTFLFGLNWGGLKAMGGQGFYYINSPEGRRIVERLHFTKPELAELKVPPYETYKDYLNHPEYRTVRAQAIERSGGVCESCEERPVTEVHHMQYPLWGTFEENADHLLALCHQCHCKVHDKED